MTATALPIFDPQPVSARIGVEIDADLSRPLAPAERAELRSLVHEHGLVVMRGQSLSAEDHVRLVEYLGPVPTGGHDGVSILSNAVAPETAGFIAEFARGSLAFHADDAFSPNPTRYISLHAIDVVDDATSTIFANAAAALGDLPPALRSKIEGLDALHVFGRYVDRRNRLRGSQTNDPHSFHSAVMLHPETGRAVVFVNYLMTDSLYGLALAESDELLQQLFDRLYAPHNLYEHRWRNGDVLLWDNMLLQHARGPVDAASVGPRKLSRVISASKGFFETHPQFRSEFLGA